MGATPSCGLCLISELLKFSHLHNVMFSGYTQRYCYLQAAFLFRRMRSQSINFKDENFADSKSSAKTAKITYLENLYAYSKP